MNHTSAWRSGTYSFIRSLFVFTYIFTDALFSYLKHVVSMLDAFALYIFLWACCHFHLWKVPLWLKSMKWLGSLTCGLDHNNCIITSRLGGHYMEDCVNCLHLLWLSSYSFLFCYCSGFDTRGFDSRSLMHHHITRIPSGSFFNVQSAVLD